MVLKEQEDCLNVLLQFVCDCDILIELDVEPLEDNVKDPK